MLDVTLLGTVKRRQGLTRAGARPGDELYVSGTIGTAAAGLRLLKDGQTTAIDASRLTQAYLRPEPRVRLGVLLARNRAASACVDLSDGLADGIRRIAEASGVGVIVDASQLPIDPAARAVFDARRLDAIEASIAAGDDYELLVAVRPRARGRLAAATRHGGVPLTRIGRCTEDRAITIRRAGADETDAALPAGYTHFR